MRELSEGRRPRDRERLMRALKDVQSGKAPGLFPGEEGAIKDLLILRIAEIDFNISPGESKWQSIAVRRGGEKFKALGADVAASIVRENSFVAHRHD